MSQTLRSFHKKRIKSILNKRGKLSYYQLMQNYMRSSLNDFEIAMQSMRDNKDIRIIFEDSIPYYYIGTLETEIIDKEESGDEWWHDDYKLIELNLEEE